MTVTDDEVLAPITPITLKSVQYLALDVRLINGDPHVYAARCRTAIAPNAEWTTHDRDWLPVFPPASLAEALQHRRVTLTADARTIQSELDDLALAITRLVGHDGTDGPLTVDPHNTNTGGGGTKAGRANVNANAMLDVILTAHANGARSIDADTVRDTAFAHTRSEHPLDQAWATETLTLALNAGSRPGFIAVLTDATLAQPGGTRYVLADTISDLQVGVIRDAIMMYAKRITHK